MILLGEGVGSERTVLIGGLQSLLDRFALFLFDRALAGCRSEGIDRSL